MQLLSEQKIEVLTQLQARVFSLLEEQHTQISLFSDENFKALAVPFVEQVIAESGNSADEKNLYRQLLFDELLGLGPLEPLLQDEGITEIMVNHYRKIYIERDGQIFPCPVRFTSEQALWNIAQRIVAPMGRHLDAASPIACARLPDGSRVHIILPPLALEGIALNIRKFPGKPCDAEMMIANNSLNLQQLRFLQQAVEQRKNIVIVGGTGSGKTTLLNLLSAFIPEGCRVITIEEAAELKLQHEHLLRLEARTANSEGKGEVSIRDLLRSALRMRPDRIIIGECRGAEALDMLQAMNTGHAGSLTTLHANNPTDALLRLEVMVMMAGLNFPLAAIRAQIVAAVDLIIQMERNAQGQRYVRAIHKILCFDHKRVLTESCLV